MHRIPCSENCPRLQSVGVPGFASPSSKAEHVSQGRDREVRITRNSLDACPQPTLQRRPPRLHNQQRLASRRLRFSGMGLPLASIICFCLLHAGRTMNAEIRSKHKPRATLRSDAHLSTPRVAIDKAPEERVEVHASNVCIAVCVRVPRVLNRTVHYRRPHKAAQNRFAREREHH